MRCPHCKGSISVYNFLREKHCPACGGVLKRMPTREQIKESLISFSEDKGYIFWAICYLIAVWVIAFFEQIIASGYLFDYVTAYKFRTLVIAAYTGMFFDYIAKS